MLTNVIKRDGRVVDYDRSRIVSAVYRACMASGTDDLELAQEIGLQVEDELRRKYADRSPSVEDIQDIVEKTLMERDMYEAVSYTHLTRAAASFNPCICDAISVTCACDSSAVYAT